MLDEDGEPISPSIGKSGQYFIKLASLNPYDTITNALGSSINFWTYVLSRRTFAGCCLLVYLSESGTKKLKKYFEKERLRLDRQMSLPPLQQPPQQQEEDRKPILPGRDVVAATTTADGECSDPMLACMLVLCIVGWFHHTYHYSYV